MACVSLFAATQALAATPASWLDAASNWSDGTLWSSTPLFPCNGNGGQSYDVTISAGTPTLDLACSIETLTLSGGGIGGSFDLTVDHAMSWSGGSLEGSGRLVAAGGAALGGVPVKQFDGSRSLWLTGPSLWNGGPMHLGSAGAELRNQFTFAVTGPPRDLGDGNNSGSFLNEGSLTLTLPVSTQVLTLSTGSFSNSGAVHIARGILATDSVGTHSGSFDGAGALHFQLGASQVLAAGASMSVSSLELTGGALTVQPGSSFSPGSLRIATGTFTMDGLGTAASLTQVGGVIAGSGTIESSGLLTWSAGSMTGSGTTRTLGGAAISGGNKTLSSPRTLALAGGTSSWSAGAIGLGGAATLRNESGSTFRVTGGTRNFTGGSLVNDGTLTVDLSGPTSILRLSPATLTNSGAIHVDEGILVLNGSYAGSLDGAGTLRVEAGSHHALSGASVTIAKVELTNVTSQLIVDAGASFETGELLWPRGQLGGSGALRVTTGAVIDETDTKFFTGASELTLAGGSSSWSEGTIELGSGGSTLRNEAGSTFTVTGTSRSLQDLSGITPVSARVHNEGTLALDLESSSASLFVLHAAVENAGSLELHTGSLRLAGSATFAQTDGTTRLAGGTTLNSNSGFPLDFQGGTLEGSGTVGTDVQSAGVISPGTSAGTLTVARHLTLLPDGELQIELGGTAQGVDYDFLSVGGNAALAGTLAPSFIAGFEQTVAPGNVFLVLQAATPLTGAFANAASGQRVLVAPDYDSLAVSYGAGSPFGANRVMLHDFQAFAANDSIQVFGSAQGGSITLVVNGVSIVVHTTPGQTAAEVAEAIAAAIRAALGLTTQGIAGVASGPVVQTNGGFQGPANVTDPGITLDGIASVPALPGVAVGTLAAVLAALGARRLRRQPSS